MATELTPTGEALAIAPLAAVGNYVSLHLSAAGTNPPTSEVSTAGTAYIRKAVTFTTSGSNPTVASNAAVDFTQATANWGTVNQFALWDAVSGGNMRGWADLGTPKAVNNGDTAHFAIGALQIQVN